MTAFVALSSNLCLPQLLETTKTSGHPQFPFHLVAVLARFLIFFVCVAHVCWQRACNIWVKDKELFITYKHSYSQSIIIFLCQFSKPQFPQGDMRNSQVTSAHIYVVL